MALRCVGFEYGGVHKNRIRGTVKSMQKTDEQTTNSLLDGWNAPPNLVTYARIALVVVFLVLDIMAGPYGVDNPTLRWVAAIIFIIAASTDKIDGWMARKYNQVTEMGKLMDPIADKLLVMSALVVLVGQGRMPSWVCIVMLAREFAVSGFRLVAAGSGRVIAAGWLGKIKTVSQMAAVILLMLFTSPDGTAPLGEAGRTVAQVVMYFSAAMTLVSGVDYIARNFDCIRDM